MQALRKGIARDFVDGACLRSLGRWHVDQRILPDGHTLNVFKQALKESLMKAMKNLKAARGDDKLDMHSYS